MSRSKKRKNPYTKKKPDPKPSLSELLLRPLPASPPNVNLSSDSEKYTPWPAFCSALKTEYREATEIHGQSGLVHPIAGLGIDEKNKRLIVISADHNPRVAALMRLDVQASMPDFRVLTARPLAVDIPHLVRKSFYDGDNLSVSKVFQLVDRLAIKENTAINTNNLADVITGYLTQLGRSDIPVKTHLHNLIEQLSLASWPFIELDGKKSALDLATKALNEFSSIDNMSADRDNGLCPIPTYEFTEYDWELLLSGQRIDDIAQRLKEMEILQYFFPSRDQLALGLIDNGVGSLEDISTSLSTAERDGHIISPNTILDSAADIKDIIDEFKRSGLVSEGELSWELSDQGQMIRNTVKFRPSEGLIARLSKIIAFRIDLNLDKLLGK